MVPKTTNFCAVITGSNGALLETFIRRIILRGRIKSEHLRRSLSLDHSCDFVITRGVIPTLTYVRENQNESRLVTVKGKRNILNQLDWLISNS